MIFRGGRNASSFCVQGGRRRVAVRLDLSGTAVPALPQGMRAAKLLKQQASLHLAKESQEEKGTEESCPQGEASVWH